MAEYTYDDIIINPYSEEAKNCIGKMVYYSDNPNGCLRSANNSNSTHCGILQKIEIGEYLPFVLENSGFSWACIMPKKEEPKPEYVPFESVDEFIKHYISWTPSIINSDYTEYRLINNGIWLRRCQRNGFSIVQCIEISDKGIILGINHEITPWKELLDAYQFIDGTPCGKLKEETAE